MFFCSFFANKIVKHILTLKLPEVINMALLPIISMHYPANR